MSFNGAKDGKHYGDMRMGHKILWMLLIGAFLFAEFRAIDKDRADFSSKEDKRRNEENDKFREIADGLKSAIQLSQQQFEETMRQKGTISSRNVRCR